MNPAKANPELIRAFYETLARVWGPQHWWPARSRFEVIAGAYLTQNTAWTNVERAMRNLRRAGLLSVEGVRRIPLAELERLVRPAGYFRQKAARLKSFVAHLDENYGGSLTRMFTRPTQELREELLSLNGIGPETADSILLYAGGHEVFVVDAYTRRVAERHGLVAAKASYEEIRELFESGLKAVASSQLPVARSAIEGELPGAAHRPSPASSMKRSGQAQTYNEMHALLVGVGKRYCWKKVAHCEACPLNKFPHAEGPAHHGARGIEDCRSKLHVERKSRHAG